MEHYDGLYARMTEAFQEETFLQKLSCPQADITRLFSGVDWRIQLGPLLPITRRITCVEALEVFSPLLGRMALPPKGGLGVCMPTGRRSRCCSPRRTRTTAHVQRDAALCFLQFLRTLFDAEREELPFDFWLDFAFCTPDELKGSAVAEEYRQFLRRFREEYIYELLRLGREVTPFRTMEHIAGVHHVSMMAARAFKRNGGLIDLALISGAAAGHDIGKFGCKPGERVPYLHYYYTDQWFAWRD